MRTALLAPLLLALAGCATSVKGQFPSAQHFHERHPDWPMEDCDRLAAGKIWIGMTEKQFLYQMRRRDGDIAWLVTNSFKSRIYERDNSRAMYLIDLESGRLSDWSMVGP